MWGGSKVDWGNRAYNRLSLTKLIMQQTVRHLIKEPIVSCLLAVCNTNPMRGHHAAPVKKRYCGGKGTCENAWAEDFCFIAQWNVLFIKTWLLRHGDLWCHWLGYSSKALNRRRVTKHVCLVWDSTYTKKGIFCWSALGF